MTAPELRTKRLILREFTEKDLDAIFAIFGDAEVNRFLPWFPVKTEQEAADFYRKRLTCTKDTWHYAFCRKEDNIPIGYVDLRLSGSRDLGYGLSRQFWGQGFVTAACKAVIDLAKRQGVPFLTATHDEKNPRSGAVMQKLGMQYQYSYEELWQPKNYPVTFRLYQLNLDGNSSRVYREYWDKSEVHFVEKLPERLQIPDQC